MEKFRIGSQVGFGPATDFDEKFAKLVEMELNCCQLCTFDVRSYTDENVEKIKAAAEKYDIEVTAIWAGWDGPCVWNFYDGPATIGIVPAAYRDSRIKQLKAGADFAYKLGVTDIITHCGFIPENPYDPDFIGVVGALKHLCNYIKPRGQWFLFETGQETPVTILRCIEEVGTGNLGVNLDTANLILYGKGNPVDALSVFGQYVRNTHCKDGFYPTGGRSLGKETKVGTGKANYPVLMKKFKEIGYTGPFVIEREISGEQQRLDIIETRDYIRNLYYAEPQVTERGILANAINEALQNTVEVVRCKDCIRCREEITTSGLICTALVHPQYVSADHFCGYGERRDQK